jgi:hypothetical protein
MHLVNPVLTKRLHLPAIASSGEAGGYVALGNPFQKTSMSLPVCVCLRPSAVNSQGSISLWQSGLIT